MSNPELIVIGAGASGMIAAGTAAQRGIPVKIFERNDRVGKKLMITGKGRCNVTNNCDIQTLMENIPVNGRFLYSAFSHFSPYDTIEFFENLGISLKTERGGRVFPVSDKAADIVNSLYKFCKDSGVDFIHERVIGLLTENGQVKGVKTQSGEYGSDAVLIATGGESYPVTGSTGDGYALARSAGHKIIKPKASLVPIVSENKDCRDMMGLSLRNVSIKVIDNKTEKCVYNDFGELLFTHFGLSGPLVLSASSHIRDLTPGRFIFEIDLKPALSEEQLDARILRDFQENKNRDFKNSLGALLPRKMIDVVIRRSGISPDEKINSITKAARLNLVRILKSFKIEISGFRPIEEAIITSGGVCVKEISPSDMQSKIVKNLYFCGEVIDADAHTGGFNLQIAFSTGFTAGSSI